MRTDTARPAPAPHAFLLRLARALLAKAERSIGAGPVRLLLDRKAAPELYVAIDADQLQLLRMQLDDLCATGWVAMLLDAPRAFAAFTDLRPRLELHDFDELAAWAGYTPQALRWQRQWMAHLATRWSAHPESAPADPAAVLDYLSRNPLTQQEGLPLEAATNSLNALTVLCRSGQSMALREVAARAFQGRSKLLDSREELLRLLGATPGQFFEAPIQLLMAAPPCRPAFMEVLFVENLTTFEHMADARAPAWEQALLVYAAGFRGSARRLRSRTGCRLYLRAPSDAADLPSIESWLFDAEERSVHFFGDLDHAGMQILANLREVFPGAAAWKPGYRQLAGLLERGVGHPPALAAKALQLDPGLTGCPFADAELLPLLRTQGCFIDQEALDLRQVEADRG